MPDTITCCLCSSPLDSVEVQSLDDGSSVDPICDTCYQQVTATADLLLTMRGVSNG